MTFKQFQETGRLSPVNDSMRIKFWLSPECSDIVQYSDGTIIQSMSTGGYVYSDRHIGGRSSIFCNKLDAIEGIVFNLKYNENKC